MNQPENMHIQVKQEYNVLSQIDKLICYHLQQIQNPEVSPEHHHQVFLQKGTLSSLHHV